MRVHICLYFFLIIIFGISCKESEKNTNIDLYDILRYIVSNPLEFEYPYFYKDQMSFEINANVFPINGKEFYNLLLRDSSELIDVRIKNLDSNNYNLIYKESFILGSYLCKEGVSYKFYKHYHGPINYKTDFYQIEYPLVRNSKEKILIFVISKKQKFNHYSYNAAYIKWFSRNAQKSNYPFLPWDPNQKYPIYMWGINKSTDSIYTNFSERSIKELYPEFNGKYVFRNLNKIIIDYQYDIESKEFYENIELIE